MLFAVVVSAALNSMVVARTGYALLIPQLTAFYSWSYAEAGATITFLMIGIAIGTPVAGALADRHGPRIVLLPLVAVAGLMLMLLSKSGGSLSIFYGGHLPIGLTSITR